MNQILLPRNLFARFSHIWHVETSHLFVNCVKIASLEPIGSGDSPSPHRFLKLKIGFGLRELRDDKTKHRAASVSSEGDGMSDEELIEKLEIFQNLLILGSGVKIGFFKTGEGVLA